MGAAVGAGATTGGAEGDGVTLGDGWVDALIDGDGVTRGVGTVRDLADARALGIARGVGRSAGVDAEEGDGVMIGASSGVVAVGEGTGVGCDEGKVKLSSPGTACGAVCATATVASNAAGRRGSDLITRKLIANGGNDVATTPKRVGSRTALATHDPTVTAQSRPF